MGQLGWARPVQMTTTPTQFGWPHRRRTAAASCGHLPRDVSNLTAGNRRISLPDCRAGLSDLRVDRWDSQKKVLADETIRRSASGDALRCTTPASVTCCRGSLERPCGVVHPNIFFDAFERSYGVEFSGR